MKAAFRAVSNAARRYSVRSAEKQVSCNRGLLEYVWAGIEANSGSGSAVYCSQTDRKIGYEKLRSASGSFAAWLSSHCEGSLALLLPNSPEAVVSTLGALEAGVPLVSFNPQSTVEELARALAVTSCPWIVTQSSLVHIALDAKKAVEATSKQDYPLNIICIDDDIIFNDDSVLQFVDLTRYYGSGTRTPKSETALVSHVWSNRGLEAVPVSRDNLLAASLHATSAHLAPGRKLLSNLPIFTRYGLCQSVLGCLSVGGELVLVPAKEDIGVSLRKHLPTAAGVVPSSLASVESIPESLAELTVPGLFCASRLPPSIAGRITQHYGPPEGPAVFSQRAQNDRTRVGQPVAGTEVRVMVGGGEVGVMSEGEIWVRGPQFGSGDDWIQTGDSGYYDPEGTFYLTKASGLSVDGLGAWPRELETVLQTHEGVNIAAVVSTGESLVAAVVPSDPYSPPTPQDLKLWLASKAAPHKQLSDIIITSSIPLRDTGDIDQAALASRFIKSKQYVAVSGV